MATQLQQPPNQRTPPIKPRGSLKMAKTPQEEGQRNQTVVKRVSPAAFERSQLPCLSQSGHELPCWLHGCTKRREAEELLKGKPQGCFLLRLSESQIGFVLSYRGKDRCRHFIIEEEGSGTYLIAGEESRHGSLQELVSFYTQNPVGPFNEILTSPCNEMDAPCLLTSLSQSSDVCDDAGKLEDEAKRDATNAHKNETQSSSPFKTIGPELDRTPEYAVVRKALKKSHSVPENQLQERVPPSRVEEFNIPDLFTSRGGPCDSDNLITDAQYARVNKPTRAMRKENKSPYVNVETLPQQQGVTDASVPRDLGYWRLESLHTYEETPHLDQWEQKSHEEIGFYATGRWRDTEANAACTQHHIYSEVNLRGTRGDPAHIAAQSLPSRTGQDANAQVGYN
uniref:uncharacterized protein isoform X2 n=1 Tax=Centroberyx gerrardi TaxID=166262 RepID=UPI003AAFA75B